ncbi:hypothetical protein ACFL6U_19950, partial [Planctomycetota bacterium]
VLVPNAHQMLRPGMRVQAEMNCLAVGYGAVLDPNLADRWLCPLHPSVILSEPGPCSQCERTCVSAQSLGYVQVTPDAVKPLLVPVSALYVTEPETRVICLRGDDQDPQWVPQAIEVEARLGPWCDVRSGLNEGDRVVLDAKQYVLNQNRTK